MAEEAPFKRDEQVYAGYPSAALLEEKGGPKQVRQLLWGDWIRVTENEADGWVKVRARGHDGWIRRGELQRERLLEVVFVDIGQGDGALLVTPDDRWVVIDAGESDNMFRFLRWRFGKFDEETHFAAGVITHPDSDHYKGFTRLLEEKNVHFDALYHNGIMEDSSSHGLCGEVEIDGLRYIDELMIERAALEAFLADEARWETKRGRKKFYGKLLHTALNSGRVGDIRMLHTHPGVKKYVPGFGDNDLVQLQVLGPILEQCSDGQKRLRWFEKRPHGGGYDKGVTKNGHSVILRLEYGAVSVLLGGDLNSSAETFLLEQYGNGGEPPRTAEARREAIRRTGLVFGCDVAKCCHHGSADFTDEFLSCVRPAATVISSGDEESHAHPRSDTLGAIGLHGRGWRPLIFSTELARSTRERDDPKLRKQADELAREIQEAASSEERARLKERLDGIQRVLDRNVAVYGAINFRTDGQRAVLAYKLEQTRVINNSVANWDIYRMEPDAAGQLAYVRPKEPVRPRRRHDDDE